MPFLGSPAVTATCLRGFILAGRLTQQSGEALSNGQLSALTLAAAARGQGSALRALN